MSGTPGIGKTAIALTVADQLRNLGLLGGDFFSSGDKDEEDLRNPTLVITTIAYQLARFDPEFNRRISAAFEEHPEAPFRDFRDQIDQLLVKPLSGIKQDPERVVVLIFDAVDECEAPGAHEILRLLLTAISSFPFLLKIFLTSRPDTGLKPILKQLPSDDLQIAPLDGLEPSVVRNDILLYLRSRTERLAAEMYQDRPWEWVDDHDLELLADKADGLFINAVSDFQSMCASGDPGRQAKLLLANVNTTHTTTSDAFTLVELDAAEQGPRDPASTARKHLHIVGPPPIRFVKVVIKSSPQHILKRLSGYFVDPSNIRYDSSKRPVRGGFGEVRRATLEDSAKGISGEVVAVKALKFSMEIELERALKASISSSDCVPSS